MEITDIYRYVIVMVFTYDVKDMLQFLLYLCSFKSPIGGHYDLKCVGELWLGAALWREGCR